MKLFRQFSAVFLLSISVFGLSSQAQELRTVEHVDVSRYLGTWFQIARKPLFFEYNCACAQQKLGALPDGTVSVYNSCNDVTPSGPLRVIQGTATNEDPLTNAKFLVDFNLPHKGQYWIIGLDSNYRYAVVSDPSKKSLYVLSKTPTLAPELLSEALAGAGKQQIDLSDLVITNQQGCTYP